MQIKEKSAEEQLIEASLNAELPKIYFNGFVNALGTGDITTVLLLNQQPVAMLNYSYTVAKTYSQMLNSIVANLEQRMQTTIMTTEDIARKSVEA